MSETDYYKILDIDKSATPDEIKKAYRKMAFKHHPDKNPDNKEQAENKFKLISEAYQTLSDPEKKEIYDKYGKAGLDGGGSGGDDNMPDGFNTAGFGQNVRFFRSGAGFKNAHDMFNSFFGGGGGDFHEFHSNVKKQRPPVVHQIKCTLENLYSGTTKKISITRKVMKKTLVTETEIVEMEILPGFKAGTRFTFKQKGDNFGDGVVPNDIICEIVQVPHNKFTRNNDDLETTVNLTLTEALCGFNKDIKMLNGANYTVSLDQLPEFNYKQKITGKGMPKRKGGCAVGYGDLIVNYNITMSKLSSDQREKIKKILLSDK